MTATREPSKPYPKIGEASSSKQPPSQSTMSKAEQSRQRRAIQEQQRAAKAAAKAAGNPPPAQNQNQNRPRSGSKAVPNATLKEKGGQHFGKPAKDNDTTSVAGDDLASTSRGLRIFSHFGLPKTVSHIAKGNIHPTIVRLGLQFSDFKISGANARCIATLTAFKVVCQA